MLFISLQGVSYVFGRCGIQMSQATSTKFSMLYKHNYGKLFWKFGDHSFNLSFVHGPSWLRVLEFIHRYGVIFTFWKKKFKRSLWGHAWCQRNILYWRLKVSGLSSLGLAGVPRHTQILADQLTLFQPGGQIMQT